MRAIAQQVVVIASERQGFDMAGFQDIEAMLVTELLGMIEGAVAATEATGPALEASGFEPEYFAVVAPDSFAVVAFEATAVFVRVGSKFVVAEDTAG